jgi:hypothetical protein
MNRRQFLPGLALATHSVLDTGVATTSALASDGALLAKGRRLFPLALYQLPETKNRSASLRAAKDAGFDIVHSAATREALDELSSHGLLGWCTVGSTNSGQPDQDRKRIASIVDRLRDHPALLYWETEDEPSYQWNKPGVARVSPAVINETAAYLRGLDPTRLHYLNHAPTNLVSTLREYNPAGDLIATDVYPVAPHGIRPQYALWPDGRQGDLLNPYISQVGKYAGKMREVAGPRRSVFMVLQAFAWEMLRDAKDRDPRMVLYPTADQLRFMACQSIVHGVNGLVWWGLRFTPPEAALWDDLVSVTKLLTMIRDQLSAPRTAIPVQIDYHDTGHSLDRGVEWIAKSAGGKTAWIAVNADPNPVDVTVRGLPARIEVLSGGHPERSGAGWRARFQPFGVSIWRFGV